MGTMAQDPLEHLFLITGTTQGLGRALAASALRLPNSFVVSLSRSAPFLWNNRQNVCIDLNDAGGIGPAFKRIDLGGRRRTDRLSHTVLINNAGVLEPIGPIGDCDDALLARNIQVNLIAPLILSRHFFQFSRGLPGYKWIVNITSGASRSPYYGWSAYGAGKAGLDMATRAMAKEFSRIDPAFRACAVAPGTVDTAMQEKIRACTVDQFEQVDKFLGLKASGALYPADRVASTLIRLLMDGRFVNGGRYDLRDMGAMGDPKGDE
jgi:benzil reductase ((S)-benzoin forming)